MMLNPWVALAGGLGNQFFQYAHSISNLVEQGESTLECVGFSLGSGKTSSPDIASFLLPQSRVSTDLWSNTYLEKKSFNYLLRSSSFERPTFRFNPMIISARAVVSPRIYFMHSQKKSNQKVGEDYRLSPHLEIGYFQSSLVSPKSISTMQGVSLRRKSATVEKFVELAKIERPLIVHVRRGDYRANRDLGCLSAEYYKEALQNFLGRGKVNKIWLFSDDVEASLQVLDPSIHSQIRIIEPSIGTPETFEIMRLGHGYILANSSFSFWAAILRRNQHSDVCAPTPWFKKSFFQSSNYPLEWNLIPSSFDSD
jgi:hypothetical protein